MRSKPIWILNLLLLLLVCLAAIFSWPGRGPDLAGIGSGPDSAPWTESVPVPALADYQLIDMRPLFNPIRRPVPTRSASSRPAPARATPPPPPPQGRVHGLMGAPGEALALFQPAGQTRILRLRVGEEVQGWTVREIGAEAIEFERAGFTHRILLRPDP
ncbi:MAG: hypothetical protein ACNA8J_09980 [Gammaproteobacteria bacterium]